MAAAGPDTDVLTLVLDTGAVVEKRSAKDWYTPLHIAALQDKAQAISTLLDRGATIDRSTKKNQTALNLAIETKSPNATKVLISRGASLKKAIELRKSKIKFRAGMRNETIQSAIAEGISVG